MGKGQSGTTGEDILDAVRPTQLQAEVAGIVARMRAADSGLMRLMNQLGGRAEGALAALPPGVRHWFEGAVRQGLGEAYRAAARTRPGPEAVGIGARALRGLTGDPVNRALATVTGALGGSVGLASAAIELPMTTTLIFRALQDIAEEHGEDAGSGEVRVECLKIFASGGPMKGDDGVDLGFLGARISLTGPALQALLTAIAPRFAAILGQKLAAQTVPVLGAISGAGINWSFMGYYQEMARVRFGLRRLARRHGEAAVLAEFRAALAREIAPPRR